MNSTLSAGALRHFKQTVTNENRLIAQAISELLPADGGLIVDIGAGLGDIADLAFPDREALLIDILHFEDAIAPRHWRQMIDFFDYMPEPGTQIDLMLFSHVLQYVDDDEHRFLLKMTKLAPRHIITVLNDATEFMADLKKWFAIQALPQNAETAIPGFPSGAYELRASRQLESTITCRTFAELALQIGVVLFDAPLDEDALAALARWLHRRLNTPTLVVPETVSLYRKKQSG